MHFYECRVLQGWVLKPRNDLTFCTSYSSSVVAKTASFLLNA